MAPLSQASAQAITRLRAYRPPPSIYSSLPVSRRAAVLLLLFADRHGDLRVVLTLRSSNLSTYAGQVSLPGGKADSLSETPFQTARREASEEIGLPTGALPPPFSVEHLCELPTHLAVTDLGVRPCVAFIHTGDTNNGQNHGSNGDAGDASADAGEALIPRLNAKEVAAIFSAPFRRFVSDQNADGSESGIVRKGSWAAWHGGTWRMHQFYVPRGREPWKAGGSDEDRSRGAADDNAPYKVFGLTARMLVDAARIAYGMDPDFEHNETLGEEDIIEDLLHKGLIDGKKWRSRRDAKLA